MLEAYALILRTAGLDTRRALVGAHIALRDARLVSLYVREFIADLQQWREGRVEEFLAKKGI